MPPSPFVPPHSHHRLDLRPARALGNCILLVADSDATFSVTLPNLCAALRPPSRLHPRLLSAPIFLLYLWPHPLWLLLLFRVCKVPCFPLLSSTCCPVPKVISSVQSPDLPGDAGQAYPNPTVPHSGPHGPPARTTRCLDSISCQFTPPSPLPGPSYNFPPGLPTSCTAPCSLSPYTRVICLSSSTQSYHLFT